MRAQRRRFVVEVKRGTSRASFISTDAAAEKFSSAEDALFGPKGKTDAATPAVTAPSATPSLGRVLRDLQEPPPPVPDVPQPARRGRKPGSKNKPKPVFAAMPAASEPRRERPLWADAVAESHAGLGSTPEPFSKPAPGEPSRHGEVPQARDMASPSRRTRLRDRSTIIKRYVLGTEPLPGQTGWIRGGLRSRR